MRHLTISPSSKMNGSFPDIRSLIFGLKSIHHYKNTDYLLGKVEKINHHVINNILLNINLCDRGVEKTTSPSEGRTLREQLPTQKGDLPPRRS